VISARCRLVNRDNSIYYYGMSTETPVKGGLNVRVLR